MTSEQLHLLLKKFIPASSVTLPTMKELVEKLFEKVAPALDCNSAPNSKQCEYLWVSTYNVEFPDGWKFERKVLDSLNTYCSCQNINHMFIS